MACTHERPEGRTECRCCHAAYMRQYRIVTRSRDIRSAKARGAEEMRVLVARRFEELGDMEINGRFAAEIVRMIALD